MSFIYCHLNFHTNLLRPWRFPLMLFWGCSNSYYIFNYLFLLKINPLKKSIKTCSLFCKKILFDFHTSLTSLSLSEIGFVLSCRYNPRMDYVSCLLTLKSSEKWRSPLFSATCNFNDQILPYGILLLTLISANVFYLLSFIWTSYIYLLIFTKSLWLHVKHFIVLTKRERVRRIICVTTDQDYPCQHIDQWPQKQK
jgi:hypothetical protein